MDKFTFVDVVRQVVGVGSVGMEVYLVLLQGRGPDDPLFLQIKQAGPSVYEPHLNNAARSSPEYTPAPAIRSSLTATSARDGASTKP